MFEKTRTLLEIYRAREPQGLTLADTALRAPGFRSIQAHRLAHFCALQGWRGLADGIAAFAGRATGVWIHADARIGENVYLAPGTMIGPDGIVPDDAEVFPKTPALLTGPDDWTPEDRLVKMERTVRALTDLVEKQNERIAALEAALAGKTSIATPENAAEGKEGETSASAAVQEADAPKAVSSSRAASKRRRTRTRKPKAAPAGGSSETK